jgi:hypothetical protein
MRAKTKVVAKMTVQEAYANIKSNNPDKIVVECLEFDDFYAFALKDKGTENEDAGGGYDTINKATGNMGTFIPVQDFDAFFAAKQIDISTFY